eukprot:CAMPEP_0180419146 /NCGR_PEP_ID=MMETSP1036_2-20121128/1936_1 /TAXON_ID=632150 /ORGANISM="Azadinium spinosum, Strain 3D9" /LENGTH=51 /DNA_ID=CAMNT_0022424273 /DNA_START=145 /DNA_END=296 /DNA_ORIENTATION=-
MPICQGAIDYNASLQSAMIPFWEITQKSQAANSSRLQPPITPLGAVAEGPG